MTMETAASAALSERLRASLPGGDTRTTTYYGPYPLAMARGSGYRLTDVDGNTYVDLLGNYTALVHGHAHPAITAAIQRQAAAGTGFAAPHPGQAELADLLCARIGSVERLRFTNSGTEATMLAVRAARAWTHRTAIVKADGGYHGSWEQTPVTRAGPHRGTPPGVLADVLWVDYNDAGQLADVMAAHGERVAALVFEPVMGAGGVLPAEPAFLATARRLADQYGALLLLDEVMTLRLAPGGRQAELGVRPDLTTLGKIIGGGLPVGAVGGRADVLDQFDPRRPGHVDHGGTGNGNPVTTAAGLAALRLLDDAQIARLNRLGDRLAAGLRGLLAAGDVPGVVTSCGSLVQLHLGRTDPVRTHRDVEAGHPLLAAAHRAALRNGLFFAPRGLLCLSTPMDDAVVDDVLERFAATLAAVAGHVPL